MTPRLAVAAFAAASLAGCATVVHGPTRLLGQELEAATALYGSWDDRIERHGRQIYVWRRSVELTNGETRSCELRVTLGFRRTIAAAAVEGFRDACRLYDMRYETVTR